MQLRLKKTEYKNKLFFKICRKVRGKDKDNFNPKYFKNLKVNLDC